MSASVQAPLATGVDAASPTSAQPASWSWRPVLLPCAVVALLLLAWDRAIAWQGNSTRILPTPWETVLGIAELAREGRLHRYIAASLIRVGWGFLTAMLVGVPLGLVMGWWKPVSEALSPIAQALRPISPIAWIPVAILWFKLSMITPIFLIFLASVFPITVAAAAAVRGIQPVYLRAARNFALGPIPVLVRVILPAALPQVLTGLRIALGIAWLVVVAAEMVVVDPETGGLGYLIIDARSGSRYDLVVAGMVLIGLIGLVLDIIVRQCERFDEVRWAFEQR